KSAIRRRSKTPGVMITQYAAILPEDKSTPDFQCKPMPVTVKEGNLAIFKAVVTGDPKPDVSWRRAKGNLADKEKFQKKYDESTGEHILEIHKVSAEEADTYKCYAVNECGKAVCTTTLSIVDVTVTFNVKYFSKAQTAGGDNDETFWDAMMNADKRDYESICSEYGVADLNTILKKLEEKRNQKGKNKQKDVIISYDNDAKKQDIQSLGKKNYIRNEGTVQHDTGIYIGDVEEANLSFSLPLVSNVDFVIKIQEIKAEESDDALFECVLTHPLPKITWMRKGVLLEDGEKCNITVSDNRLIHRLLIKDCTKLDKGIYSAVAGIISCSAWLVVEDDNVSITMNGPIHKLVIMKCSEDNSGKYRFEADGRKTEAITKIISTGSICLDPPRFDPEDLSAFTRPLAVKVGHNATYKLQFIGHKPIKVQWYKDGDELKDDNSTMIERSASHTRLLLSRCQRRDTGEIKIKIKNDHGFTEAVSQLVVLDKPSPPLGPAEVTESSALCIEFKWRPPKDDGGSPVTNYILERQQVGRNTWKKMGEIPGVPIYRDTDVDRGRKYCYRIWAVTSEGMSEVMETDEMQAGKFAFPGPPAPPKVVSAFNDCINISWSSPSSTGGSRLLGYILEKRKQGSNLWTCVNAPDEIIKEKKYAVKDVVEGIEYEFRVCAVNLSGAGEFSNASEFVFARDPKMRPRFTNNKMKSFMVVRAGNSVRITVNFEASPWPEITWLKDNVPVMKRVTISNSDGSSQLLIPTSERLDSGIYSVLVKNIVGQETFSTEVRVTDDPKPPGPVELEESVPGTVTVIWQPSPDEKRDDRLHYTVSKLESTKHTWTTVADRLFNNRFTVCNIMQGREYHFRVYAKNDMGISAPSESPIWGMEKKKEKMVITEPSRKDCDLRCTPSFIVPLKPQTATVGYECYMSCAVKGDPAARITWYRNHVSINTDTNYYVSNTCGVCSLLILRVGPKDVGEYKVVADNSLGRAECSTVLSVRGKTETWLHFCFTKKVYTPLLACQVILISIRNVSLFWSYNLHNQIDTQAEIFPVRGCKNAPKLKTFFSYAQLSSVCPIHLELDSGKD
uniref:Immunoglobulin like and fibronectin type III domain containing 1, tandem duplicate 2 n=1 Tax=Poecilia mexicana TaxID=48701 RepID=A0A3B3WRL8_9TELE